MRTSNRFQSAASFPFDTKSVLTIAKQIMVAVYHAVVSKLLLLLSGDVQSNPCPTEVRESCTQTETSELSAILEVMTRLESNQEKIISDLGDIRSKQRATDEQLEKLTERVNSSEQRQATSSNGTVGAESVFKVQSAKIAALKACTDDAENRLRRNNLLFFGLPDSKSETWEESEEIVVSFCSDKLGVALDAVNMDRARRLGSFGEGKIRPIIARFVRFKDEESVLTSDIKLKDTEFSVREDLTRPLRVAWKKLLEFGKALSLKYKLRHDKLFIDGRCYLYDVVSETIVQSKK